jgi:1-acylglycerone phosphate reductase
MAAKRTVLITGCSEGGIGHSLALEFARQRFHFSVTTRHFSSMMSLSTNPDITLLELNVTSQSSIQNAHGVVAKVTGGTLDIIYRNAGV